MVAIGRDGKRLYFGTRKTLKPRKAPKPAKGTQGAELDEPAGVEVWERTYDLGIDSARAVPLRSRPAETKNVPSGSQVISVGRLKLFGPRPGTPRSPMKVSKPCGNSVIKLSAWAASAALMRSVSDLSKLP